MHLAACRNPHRAAITVFCEFGLMPGPFRLEAGTDFESTLLTSVWLHHHRDRPQSRWQLVGAWWVPVYSRPRLDWSARLETICLAAMDMPGGMRSAVAGIYGE